MTNNDGNPGTVQTGERQTTQNQKSERNRAGSGDGDGTDNLGLDPLLIALLKKIPPADKGWPGPSRVRWFQTFAMNVSQIYDGDDEPVEMKIAHLADKLGDIAASIDDLTESIREHTPGEQP